MHNPLNDAKKATELQLSMLAAQQQPLSPLVQETFEKTFQIVATRIEKASDSDACELVDRLIQIAHVIDPALRQNQSFFGEHSSHPYALQIPARDLLALYAARASMNHLLEYLRGTGASQG